MDVLTTKRKKQWAQRDEWDLCQATFHHYVGPNCNEL